MSETRKKREVPNLEYFLSVGKLGLAPASLSFPTRFLEGDSETEKQRKTHTIIGNAIHTLYTYGLICFFQVPCRELIIPQSSNNTRMASAQAPTKTSKQAQSSPKRLCTSTEASALTRDSEFVLLCVRGHFSFTLSGTSNRNNPFLLVSTPTEKDSTYDLCTQS